MLPVTLDEALGPLRMGTCPIHPNSAKQELFLLADQLEVFYGGAAGPGKSWGLLMAALQYTDVPGYRGLLLRPALTEFEQLIDLSHEWLSHSPAVWSGQDNSWRWPGDSRSGAGGARLRFSYLANLADVSRYKGREFQFVGFDELTGFTEQQYQRMFRVLRKPREATGKSPDGLTLSDVPLRMRSASNPGGPGHGWVKTRFVDQETRAEDAVFIRARMQDNPDLDVDGYLSSLSHLDPAERERLVAGDWNVNDEGFVFDRSWFPVVEEAARPARSVRFWDLAGTEPSVAATDPDYTVGLRLDLLEDGLFNIRHVVRDRVGSGDVERLVRATAEADGREVATWLEQEPGSSGKALVYHYKRNILRGFACYSQTSTGSKEIRARPVAAAAANGLVRLVRGGWPMLDFLDELAMFPNAPHDDCVDALSGAHSVITRRGPLTARAPRGKIPSVEEQIVMRGRQ